MSKLLVKIFDFKTNIIIHKLLYVLCQVNNWVEIYYNMDGVSLNKFRIYRYGIHRIKSNPDYERVWP